jgi:UDP-N-acetylglucosamine 4,6-dehydratase/5-epimerase
LNKFNGKTLLITGGTGSFGHAVFKRFAESDLNEIRILSRDEKKQDDMRKRYQSSKLKFYVGDVRDMQSVMNATRGADYIFHGAALKQVPACEFYPLEAVKTNILGTENILEAAVNCNVKKVVSLSTDKAVYPINAMGISKAMMEKIVVSKSRVSDSTVISATRYGNVMASRGSVIPLFINQIREGKKITITDPNMTRFMMSLDEAVGLVLFAFENANPGDIFVQKAPAVTIEILVQAIKEVMNVPDYPTEIIGTRHGEKLYEVLMSREETAGAKSQENYFRIPPDLRDLNYSKYVEEGEINISTSNDFNSVNTKQLSLSDMKKMLLTLPYMKSISKGIEIDPEE